MTTRSDRLHKSSTNSVISGVAGGMAEYFDVDPTLMRVGWVILGLASAGTAIIAYIALVFVMPKDDSPAPDPDDIEDRTSGNEGHRTRNQRRRYLLAFVLIAVGAVLLASNLGVLFWWRWDELWPTLLIAIGALTILNRYRNRH